MKEKKAEVKESGALVLATNPSAMMRQSTDVADVCKQIVTATAIKIQGRGYVKVEGWQSIATAHGCISGSRDVERVDGGFKAVGELRRISDGVLLATAEGFVGEDEATWFGGETEKWEDGRKVKKMLPRRADYAIRAMAQTRAISRVCRSAFAHIVVLMDAGLSTTPAEEMDFNSHEEKADVPRGARGHNRGRPYEDETGKDDPKVATDLVKLETFLNQSEIPEGFLLALLRERKLIDGRTTTIATLKPGILARCLLPAARQKLQDAWLAQKEDEAEPKKEKKANARETRTTREGDQTPEGTRRKPTAPMESPQAALAEADVDDWRKVPIPYGVKEGTKLGTLSKKDLIWWIENWVADKYRNKWQPGTVLFDAALCLASEELGGGQ